MAVRETAQDGSDARRLRVFISSRMEELLAERAAIREALADRDVDVFVFESDAGARPRSIVRTYLEEESGADVYIGVFWKGYGPHTIAELEYALSLGLDCLIYEKLADGGRDPALQALLDRLGEPETGLTIGRFETADELRSTVQRDVAALLVRRFRDAKEERAAIFHGVPSAVPADFVGRRAELVRMVRALRSGQDAAIEGLPGIGKTTLAIALAHHGGIRRHFRGGVLWASLGPRAEIADALAGWGQALRRAGLLTGDLTQLATLEERAQALRDAIGRRRMLLVIDDVWDTQAAEILRCGGPACAHVITTRNRQVAKLFGGAAHEGPLPALDEEEAWNLLQQLAPDACQADPPRARQLVRAVGGLPQAVRLVGGYLARPDASMFASVFGELSANAIEEMGDPLKRLTLAERRLGSRSNAKTTLADTILLSLHDLPEGAWHAFGSLGAFAAKPERFSPDAAIAVAQCEAGALALLAGRNLIEVDATTRTLTLHPTVADVARSRMPPESIARHREHYLQVIRDSGGEPSRIAAVYGQLRWAWRQAPDDETLFVLLGAALHFQEHRGLSAETIEWVARALPIAERRAEFRPVVARLLAEMGEAESALRRYADALAHFTRALAIWESLDEHHWRVFALTRIANALESAGRADEALGRIAEAEALAREHGDRAQHVEVRTLTALLLRNAGRYEAAKTEVEAALAEVRELSDKDGEADCLLLLATIHRSLGQYERALACLRQATELRIAVGNESGHTEARVLAASLARERGQLDDALATAREACDKAEASGPRDLYVEALRVLANVLSQMERFDEAERVYTRQLEVSEEMGNRAGCAWVLQRLATVYAASGRPAEERAALERALAIYRELGMHAEQADTLELLFYSFASADRPDPALACMREAAAIWGELKQPADRARALAQIGGLLSRLEQREESLAAYAEADATFAPRNDAISRPGIRSPSVPPLILAIGTRLARWLAGGMIRPRLLEALDEARDAIRASWGVLPPGIIVADGYAGVSRDSYLVELHSVPLVSATLYENERLWPGPVEELAAAGLTGRATIQPDSGRPAAWLGREDWSLAERSGLPLWTDVEYIRRHLQAVLGKHLHELIGHQQVMTMAEQEAPASADALARNPSALTALVLVLRNLLEEGVPILNFREIVDAVVPMHRAGQDRLGILREIRLLPALRARLPGNAADGPLLALEDPLESEIAAAVRVIDGCSYLALDPARTQYVLGRVRAAMSLRSDLRGVVVTNGAIRRYVARLVDLEFPGLWVVSREELLPEREAAIVSVALANGASTS